MQHACMHIITYNALYVVDRCEMEISKESRIFLPLNTLCRNRKCIAQHNRIFFSIQPIPPQAPHNLVDTCHICTLRDVKY